MIKKLFGLIYFVFWKLIWCKNIVKSKVSVYDYYFFTYNLYFKKESEEKFMPAHGDITLPLPCFPSKGHVLLQIAKAWGERGYQVRDVFITSLYKFKNRYECALWKQGVITPEVKKEGEK